MLAIIIPYYKLTFFEATLKSLANQTNKNFKVYIGDDNSPENPIKLLEHFRGKFDFDYCKFDTNLGSITLTKQWERCVKLASNEEWIMILGDDDELDERVVDEWYQNYQKFNSKYNVVRFASQIQYIESATLSTIFRHPTTEFYKETYFKKLKGISRSSLSEYIFKKDVYKKYGFCNYPLAWNSDDRAWFDFSENKPIFSINTAIVKISISNKSISGIEENQRLKNESLRRFYKFLLFGKILNLEEKNEISNLYLKLPKENIDFYVRVYIYGLKKINRIKL